MGQEQSDTDTEIKEKYGKFTDDDLKQIKGDYEKFVGKSQERYGDKRMPS